MLNNSIIFSVTLITLGFLFSSKVRSARLWKATVTPLASIIGSGFLVIAPLLALTTGRYSLAAIALLVALGYACGVVMRFNIKSLESVLGAGEKGFVIHVESFSKLALGFAYIISITFYLKLLAAFVLKGLQIENSLYGNILTTAILIFVAGMGKLRGLNILEIFEEYSVSVKISIIMGLLAGLFYYNVDLFWVNQWHLQIPQPDINLNSLRVLTGSLIVVQGFETSRFLGTKYTAEERVRTMRWAQILSGVIYFVFIALIAVVFSSKPHISDTEIIDLTSKVSTILPGILIFAAVMSQFSAAVADTVGSGGLLHETFRGKVSLHNCYLLVGAAAIVLTWTTNIFEVISLASRAFALYYGLQAMVAAGLAHQKKQKMKCILFSALSVFLYLILVFGAPAKV